MNAIWRGFSNTYQHPHGIIVPFNGITIPENARSVRFDVVWDIDGIIERYKGKTDNNNDDIYVLKNGFWNAFSVNVEIAREGDSVRDWENTNNWEEVEEDGKSKGK